MVDSLGAITWWGLSPSLNLIDHINLIKCNDKDELHLLLVGAGDIRHVLSTISHSYRRQTAPKLHFYILESSLELYARHLLFLALALEPQSKRGLQEKCELFLEIYGNILIRQQSCDYIQKMADLFIRMITDFDYLQEKLAFVDCSQLKHKERDFMEGIFKFWRNPKILVFDVEKYWDIRMRKIMGVRYDSRMNTYDWDYHMRLADRQGQTISRADYRRWRHTGVAFEIRDGTYDVPNKTLASGLIFKHDGEKCARRGYWGDMLVSPYVAVAMETEEPEMFKKCNGEYTKSSQEVAEYNTTAVLHEILNKTKYTPDRTVDAPTQGATLTEITEEDEAIDAKNEEMSAELNELSLDDEYESIPLDNVKVTFLSLNSLPDLHKKAKYRGLFDISYFSNSMVHLLTPDVTQMFTEEATVIVESAKFVLELKQEQYTAYVAKVTDMAADAHCVPIGEVDAEKDVFLKFAYNKKDTETTSVK